MTFMKKSFLMLFLGLMVFAGCNDYSSPTAVLNSSAKAIQDNNFKAFRKTFTSEFRKNNDMQKVMDTLRAELDAAAPISMGASVLANSETQTLPMCRLSTIPDYQKVDTARTYFVLVMGTVGGVSMPILGATVDCSVNYRQEPRRSIYSYCYEYNGEYCQISDLK